MYVRCTRAFARVAVLLALASADPATAASSLGPLPTSYSGMLPCADCAGLRHQLNLYPGGGYILALTYLRDRRDETFYEMGFFALDKDSTVLVLDPSASKPMQFSITRAGSLRKLDIEGREIESELEYDLRREPALLPLEPRLELRGSYTYMADAGAFTDCRSGLRFPVASGGASHVLESAFLAERTLRESLAKSQTKASKQKGAPAPSALTPSPLVVTVHARVLSRPPAGVEGNKPMLFVERLLDTFPNESCGARGVIHPLEGTRWVLTRLGATPVRLAPKQRELMIGFDRTPGRVSGHSGCNHFSGTYTLRPEETGKLQLGALAGTRMACPEPNLETPFLQALSRVQGYRITGPHLELLDAAGAVLARFEERTL